MISVLKKVIYTAHKNFSRYRYFQVHIFPGIHTWVWIMGIEDWRIGRTFSGVFCCRPTSPRLPPPIEQLWQVFAICPLVKLFHSPKLCYTFTFCQTARFPNCKSSKPFFPQNWPTRVLSWCGFSPWLASGVVCAMCITNVLPAFGQYQLL